MYLCYVKKNEKTRKEGKREKNSFMLPLCRILLTKYKNGKQQKKVMKIKKREPTVSLFTYDYSHNV